MKTKIFSVMCLVAISLTVSFFASWLLGFVEYNVVQKSIKSLGDDYDVKGLTSVLSDKSFDGFRSRANFEPTQTSTGMLGLKKKGTKCNESLRIYYKHTQNRPSSITVSGEYNPASRKETELCRGRVQEILRYIITDESTVVTNTEQHSGENSCTVRWEDKNYKVTACFDTSNPSKPYAIAMLKRGEIRSKYVISFKDVSTEY